MKIVMTAKFAQLQERQFPILYSGSEHKLFKNEIKSVPWSLLAPHEQQAMENHSGQNLETLARRGGLGPSEMVAVLQDRPFYKSTSRPNGMYEWGTRPDEMQALNYIKSLLPKPPAPPDSSSSPSTASPDRPPQTT